MLYGLTQPAAVTGELPVRAAIPRCPPVPPHWVPQEFVQRLLAARREHERGAYVVPVEVLFRNPLVAVAEEGAHGVPWEGRATGYRGQTRTCGLPQDHSPEPTAKMSRRRMISTVCISMRQDAYENHYL